MENKFCAPLYIYIGIVFLYTSLQIYKNKSFKIKNFIYPLIITFILYYLCITKHNEIAWGVLLIPFIIGVTIAIIKIISEKY